MEQVLEEQQGLELNAANIETVRTDNQADFPTDLEIF